MRPLARRWLVIPVVVVLLLGGSRAAWAAWTDPAAVTTAPAALAAHRLLDPASLTCVGGLGSSVTFRWPNVDLRYRYRLTVEQPVGTVVHTDHVANNGMVGSTQSYTYTVELLDTFFDGSTTFTVRVRSELADRPAWVSAPGATDQGTFTFGVGGC